MGHRVVNVDVDQDVVDAINDGVTPVHEPGLGELLSTHGGDGLTATTDYADVLDTEITFLALPTPSRDDGRIDTSIIEAAAATLGETLTKKDDDHVVVTKSTVVPGTTSETIAPALAAADGETVGGRIHVAANPEFLREGTAVEDFRNPHKIVVGTDDERALEVLHRVYRPLVNGSELSLFETGVREAEMIKYANNSFLAAKVSLINDIGNICKEFGIDTYEVAEAIGLDDRISERFLRSGLGWGGSCFPKDTAAIRAAARERGYEPAMLDAAVAVNNRQPERLLSLMDRHVEVAGERVAVLGLSFKPGTDDIRNARSIPIIEGLKQRRADIAAFDPVAAENMRKRFSEIEYEDEPGSALEDAVAALVVTEWDEISALSEEFDKMERPVVIDGRRAIDRREGITYEGLTW
jgi:UDPglucose 6-dehydrogenase